MAPQESPRRSAAYFTGWLLTVATILCRLLPMSVQTGMFFDGVTYATIARNMAIGVGDFWHPMFLVKGVSGTGLPPARRTQTRSSANTDVVGSSATRDFTSEGEFFEHPPLALWLESLLFRLLGDHYWVEKLYSALTAIGTALLMAAVWRLLLRDRPALADCTWLPVMLWAVIPTWSWLYASNMLENTLGLFAIASVYASLRAASGGPRAMVGWTLLAAAFVLGAVLCKGPVGLYPLATPALIAVAFRRWNPPQVAATVILPATFAALLGLLLLHAPAYQFLNTYYHVQVEASLAGNREIFVNELGHFSAVGKIVREVCVPAIIAAALVMWARSRRRTLGGKAPLSESGVGHAMRPVLYFSLLTAASASLPILISPKQLGHYVAPSYPYFALALAIACCEAVVFLMNTGRDAAHVARSQRRVQWVCGCVICGMVILACVLVGRPGRDKALYRDTLALGRILPAATVVKIGPELSTDWSLKSYLARWGQTGTADNDVPQKYCLTLKGTAPPEGYVPLKTDLDRYQLNQRVGDVTTGYRR